MSRWPKVLYRHPAEAPSRRSLPADLAEAYRFAEAVVTQSGDEAGLRERIRQRHGEAGLVEMAMAIAVCRMFPTFTLTSAVLHAKLRSGPSSWAAKTP